jgi:hypothetical protein
MASLLAMTETYLAMTLFFKRLFSDNTAIGQGYFCHKNTVVQV